MSAKKFLAIDLGAESGRAMLGSLERGKLTLEEVHRFPNEPVKVHESLCWDLPRLLLEVTRGIQAGASRTGGKLDGIGCDSWGVDFGLLDRAGGLLANPVHYRDSRTVGMMEELHRTLPREKIFSETGIQFLSLNTIYQVAALRKRAPTLLVASEKLLLMADLFHYLLSGRAVSERTLASTSQMWNPSRRAWSDPIANALGIPRGLLPEVVPPGSVIGPLREEIARAAGLSPAPSVIAPASHDTASAIAAIPVCNSRPWGYLSSGTWSLLGIELPAPRITKHVCEAGFTNEGGVGETTRLLRNLNGLWLVQECRRRWAGQGQDIDYAALTGMARAAGPSRAWIRPDDATFFSPQDMPAAIEAYCRKTGQEAPGSKGEIVRCVLESLALSYLETTNALEEISGQTLERLHVVGGGSRNELLNQLTADALGIPVIAGPVEATAIGNVLVQAMAAGEVESIGELRSIVRGSVRCVEHLPASSGEWDAKLSVYRGLKDRG